MHFNNHNLNKNYFENRFKLVKAKRNYNLLLIFYY